MVSVAAAREAAGKPDTLQKFSGVFFLLASRAEEIEVMDN